MTGWRLRVAGFAISAALLGACDAESNDTPGGGRDAGAGASSDAGQPSSGGSSTSSAGSSTGGTSTPGDPSDLESFWDAMAQGYCARLYRCWEPNDDFMASRWLLETPEGCEAQLNAVNSQLPSRRDTRAQIEAGNLHYVPGMGEKCIEELSACNGSSSFDQGSCREVFDGDVETGGACRRDEDCAGDAYCEVAMACPGQCQPRKASGEPCVQAKECAYTTREVFCDHDAMPEPVCRTLEPAASKSPEAAPCTRERSGSEALLLCADDLWCAADPAAPSTATGKCMAPIPLEGACTDGDDVCAEGLCDADNGVCVVYTLLKQAGETCDQAQLLGHGTCQPRLPAGSPCELGRACESGSCSATCLERYCEG